MVGIVCVSLFASLLVRLWYLQMIDTTSQQLRANGVNLRVVHTEGTRGRILDRNGKVLVDNRISIVVELDRTRIKDNAADARTREFDDLAEVLTSFGFPTKGPIIQDRYDDKRYGPLEPVPIQSDVTDDVELYLAEHDERFPGVVVRRVAVRTYPYGKLAAHIVGYVGQINDKELAQKEDQFGAADDPSRPKTDREHKTYAGGDEIGKSGVEATFESDLRGVPSDRTIQVDARGDYLKTVTEASPAGGDDVWLSIDIDLQALAEQRLADRLSGLRNSVDKDGRALNAPQGSVVITDPQNGAILAMASFPTYDPSQLVNGIDSRLWERLNDKAAGQPLFNWALQGTYAPGSTFKLFSGTAGLETGFLGSGSNVYQDAGSYKVTNCKGDGCVARNAGGNRYGQVDISKALTVSSDVFFYWIGDQLWQGRDRFGEDAIQKVAATYGLGAATGVDLPGEADGRLPTPALRREQNQENPKAFPNGNWYAGDNLNTSIGQGDVLVTPLQLADAYATFANGGTRYVPLIVSKVTRPKDLGLDPRDPGNYELVRTIEPEVSGTVTYTGDHYQRLLAGLQGVVTNGGGTANRAWAANRTAWPMAGKTGTAEVNGKADTSIFVAFGPSPSVEPPKYAISVIIPEAGFGSDVSAPLAFGIMRDVSNNTVPSTVSDADRARWDTAVAKALAEAAANPTTTTTTTSIVVPTVPGDTAPGQLPTSTVDPALTTPPATDPTRTSLPR